MTKTIRLLTVLLALVLVAGLAAPVAQAQTKTKLVMLNRGGEKAEVDRLTEILNEFNKNSKDTEVSFSFVPEYDQTLQNALAGGTPPDVFWVDGGQFLNLVTAGALAPVGDKLTKPDDFYPGLREVFSYQGKFYCPPKDFSILALQINTDMFEKAKVKEPTNWAELEAAAKALTTDKVAGLVLSPAFDRYGAWLYQAGGSVTDDAFTKMTINSKEALAALKYYVGLYTKGYAKTPADLGAGWGGEAFGKGLTAIATEGNWIVGPMAKDFPTIKYKSLPLPAGPDGKKASLAFTVCYAVSAKSKNVDAAVKFMDYLVGGDAMAKWTDLGFLPPRKSLAEAWVKKFPDLKVYLDSAEFARKWTFIPGFNLVIDKANEQLQLLFKDQVTAEDALKAIEDAGKQVLAKATATPAK